MARVKINGTDLPATATTIHPVNAERQTTWIDLALCNHTANDRQVQVWLVPAGQSEADKYLIIDYGAGNPLLARRSSFSRWMEFMGPGYKIMAKSDSASSVSLHLSVIEDAEQETQIGVDGVELGTGFTTLYTADASAKSRQSTLIHLTLCNHQLPKGDVSVWMVPNGIARADPHKILDMAGVNQVKSHTTMQHEWTQFLQPGDTIQAQLGSANGLSAKLSVLEEAIA